MSDEAVARRSVGETLPRVAPFAAFMIFVALDEAAGACASRGLIDLPAGWRLYTYPLRTVAALAALFHYRGAYREIVPGDLRRAAATALSVAAGIGVYLLWISLDGTVGLLPAALDPMAVPEPLRGFLLAVRLGGSFLVVPVMEELFWRSWLLRRLQDEQVSRVPIGAATPTAFVVSCVLFGLEHSQVVAGIVAGAVYTGLLVGTRSLAQCILSHAVTNLALGIHVLAFGAWRFW